MNADTKVKWLGSLLVVCAIAISAESYYLWSAKKSHININRNVSDSTLSTASPAIPNTWSGDGDPTTELKQMQQQMDKLMNQLSTTNSMFNEPGFETTATPKISMREEAKDYKVVVDLPKGQKAEINTDISGNELTIDGKIKQLNTSHSNSADQQSLSINQFSQTMQFPEPIKDSDIKIQRSDNQIVITVPKVG